MIQILEELEGKSSLYRVFILGISNHMSNNFYYTHAKSEDQALSSIVTKVLKHVQSPASTMKSWVYQDGRMRIPMNMMKRGLLISYLQANPHLVKIEKRMGQ